MRRSDKSGRPARPSTPKRRRQHHLLAPLAVHLLSRSSVDLTIRWFTACQHNSLSNVCVEVTRQVRTDLGYLQPHEGTWTAYKYAGLGVGVADGGKYLYYGTYSTEDQARTSLDRPSPPPKGTSQGHHARACQAKQQAKAREAMVYLSEDVNIAGTTATCWSDVNWLGQLTAKDLQAIASYDQGDDVFVPSQNNKRISVTPTLDYSDLQHRIASVRAICAPSEGPVPKIGVLHHVDKCPPDVAATLLELLTCTFTLSDCKAECIGHHLECAELCAEDIVVGELPVNTARVIEWLQDHITVQYGGSKDTKSKTGDAVRGMQDRKQHGRKSCRMWHFVTSTSAHVTYQAMVKAMFDDATTPEDEVAAFEEAMQYGHYNLPDLLIAGAGADLSPPRHSHS